ncbi:MAG TPA: L-rhamnose mutarotase [Lacunisphaera sp.]|jgi:L-rhamnose mutarotase|nr:L-rhamnose mutarotase [Lacunisphaera sp.]
MRLEKAAVAVALLGLLAAGLFASMKAESSHRVRRFHAVTGLRPEKAEYYFQLHAAVWPGVLKMIRQAHIRNFSIAVKEIEGKHYLFSYYEYVGDDYEADMKRIAADPETQRWWRETEPCQLPLPDAAAKRAIWADAREVFYTP